MKKVLLLLMFVIQLVALELYVFKIGKTGLIYCTPVEVKKFNYDLNKSILKIDYTGNEKTMSINGEIVTGCDEELYQKWLLKNNY